jgi:hypothetical protein
MTGKSLVYYEDIYRSKGEYPFFDACSQRERLEQFFGQLTRMEGEKLSQR